MSESEAVAESTTQPPADADPISDHGQATEAKIAEVIRAAEKYGKSSIIALAGVPGTGKSYVGKIAAQRLAGEPTRVREIQFHPSTTYEEFVEGLRINPSGGIDETAGLFLEWNELALGETDEAIRYVILIDEMTRARVNAVLGELLTYIEDRSQTFTTTYSRRPVRIAQNLTVIATYNPTDRSAIEIDGALLRRLRIVRFAPDPGQLHDMLVDRVPQPVVESLAAIFDDLKASHDDFEDLMPFGHGIFAEVHNETPDLHELWEQRIRYFLYRPLMAPHPYAAEIRAAYPWHDVTYVQPTHP